MHADRASKEASMSTERGGSQRTPASFGRSSDGLDRAMVSVRVVYIDFYLASLSSLSTSTAFYAALLTSTGVSSHLRRPIVRIYGSTPAGQSVAVHLHGALPYFYLPLPHSVSQEATPSFVSHLRKALEDAMKNMYHPEGSAAAGSTEDEEDKSGQNPDLKFICDIVPVIRTSIYGYQGPRVFLKVIAWAPSWIPRLAAIAASGGLGEHIGPLQPFESHIPFTLQVMTDLGLVGMGYANFATCKFRGPLPDVSESVGERPWLDDNLNRVFGKGMEEDTPDLVWGFDIMKKSTCDLELDAYIHDVLNATDLMVKEEVTPVHQKEEGLLPFKFVAKSLKILWEEEKLRTGIIPRLPIDRSREVIAGTGLTEPRLRVLMNDLTKISSMDERTLTKPSLEEFADVAAWLGGESHESDMDVEDSAESYEKEWNDIADCTQTGNSIGKALEEAKQIPQLDGPNEEEINAKRNRRTVKVKKRKRWKSGGYEPLILSHGTQTSAMQFGQSQVEENRLVPAYTSQKCTVKPKSAYVPLVDGSDLPKKRVRWTVDKDERTKQACLPVTNCDPVLRNDAAHDETMPEDRCSHTHPRRRQSGNGKAEFPAGPHVTNEKPMRGAKSVEGSPISSKKSSIRLPNIPVSSQERSHIGLGVGEPTSHRNEESSCGTMARSGSEEVNCIVAELLDAPFQAQRAIDTDGTFQSDSSTFPSPTLGSYAFVLSPLTLPPNRTNLISSFRDSGLPVVKYPRPFYSHDTDAPRRNVTYAGTTFVVPAKPGLLLPYEPVLRGTEGGTEQLSASIVTPVIPPPSLLQLLSGSQAGFSGSDFAIAETTALDSVGRQVRVGAAFGDLKTQAQTELDGFTSQKRGRLRRRIKTGFQESSSDDSEEERSIRSLVGGLTQDTAEEDSVRAKRAEQRGPEKDIVQKPSSPKYDETSFFMALPSLRNRTLSQKGKFRCWNVQGSETASEKKRRNPNEKQAAASPLHEHQNLTVAVIEILAKTRGDLLPDPRFDPVCAVAVLTQEERRKGSGTLDHGVVFANLERCGFSRGKRGDSFREDLQFVNSEHDIFEAVGSLIRSIDADILAGYETQNGSIGYLLERAAVLGRPFAREVSRMPEYDRRVFSHVHDGQRSTSAAAQYFRRKGVNISVSGRHVINVWRVVRSEVKLAGYSLERVVSEVLGKRIPIYPSRTLAKWFSSGYRAMRALRSLLTRAKAVICLIQSLDVLGRTGELARVFGIDFMSVLTRGSQFRVESMMIRVAHAKGFVLLAAQRDQVFKQPAIECLPLVMEPISAFYTDPVIVLDFRSLYPSMIIAHNLCFSTMLGNIRGIESWTSPRDLGVLRDYVPPSIKELGGLSSIYVAPNGEAFATASLRKGILPTMLKEVLATRVMVKGAMKGISNIEATAALIRLLNARQFGLKMIANVTYGYTSASFSGRMPCAGLADAIVQSGRSALERMIAEAEDTLKGRTGLEVVYGDTDSLFVKVPGASRKEAFEIGEEICLIAERLFPAPVELQLEKVFHPCVLVTKKRYVGYAYDKPECIVPAFDAKGIETVRRDSCAVVQKTLEKSLRILFETCDVSRVKQSVQRTMRRILSGRLPLSEFIFRKEVRLGTYKDGHMPPAAIVATKAMEADPRAVPRYGERVPFVVIYDRPGAALKDSVCSPEMFLEAERAGTARLNATYYITKQILPSLSRIFCLLGVRVITWYAELPRPYFQPLSNLTSKSVTVKSRSTPVGQNNMYRYYFTHRCQLCHENGGQRLLCRSCTASGRKAQQAYFILASRQRSLESHMKRINAICKACVGGDEEDSSQIGCVNLECPMTLRRHSYGEKIMSGREALEEASLTIAPLDARCEL